MRWVKKAEEQPRCKKTHLKKEKIGVTRDMNWSIDYGLGYRVLSSGDILELDLTPQLEQSTQWRITVLPDGTLMIIPNRFD